MARSPFSAITPLVPAGASLEAALELYVDHLGFELSWQDGAMAGVRRGEVELHLVQNSSREWADNASFSIGVADLDALHAEYADAPIRIGPLEVKAWGRREFHVILPSGVCLQFYQASPAGGS